MSNFLKAEESPFDYIKIKPDDESHIDIKNRKTCLKACENKPCTYYCPTRVFAWDEESNQIKVSYTRCIECLACPYGCPHNNIEWHFPKGGYGVNYSDQEDLS
ncbi:MULTISPECIES: ferredoxin family protein [unclassified Candidatus Frackibacter]|uniref:ferredoxin family protein n=1 Tax=unclassified Candidatus Frackibacter TaxID=2648818 RepID=UPI00079C52F4|nr:MULTISPECIES: 4Fe-4S dicluster domain-containing protein [unclassified Candidatus Frackibacter]KXS42153.1 MAG: ferredoxin-like protein [Candidatus Frackibacter sp. T328-2]SDC61413.1 ferredoxin like protein [Candidatus Frackibacter sp. WG11]SEM75221.1 ferredoxin like protein [Candidatus Frackibacter sp. WG12]SFL87002.1 ferredoxin like protein [Candidatus Frackibacter sp. WG13]